MPRFRKLPVEVEALRWLGNNFTELRDWGGAQVLCTVTDKLVLTTPHGDVRALPGDWIVKGHFGELWPVTTGAFTRSYEVAEVGPAWVAT